LFCGTSSQMPGSPILSTGAHPEPEKWRAGDRSCEGLRMAAPPRRTLCEQILLIVTLAPKASHERSSPRTDVTRESPRPGNDILFAARSSKKEAAAQAIFLHAIGDGRIAGALWWQILASWRRDPLQRSPPPVAARWSFRRKLIARGPTSTRRRAFHVAL
jgi:hypothetical protein